jgi:hypothetical protein
MMKKENDMGSNGYERAVCPNCLFYINAGEYGRRCLASCEETDETMEYISSSDMSYDREKSYKYYEKCEHYISKKDARQIMRERFSEKNKYTALCEDVKKYGWRDICLICKHYTDGVECDTECSECTKPCICNSCLDGEKWQWRGEG